MPDWTVERHTLSPPSLNELVHAIENGVKRNFEAWSVSVDSCPDLREAPFHLAGEGLCGNERIADIGGPPNLHPLPKFDRKYSLLHMTELMEMPRDRGFILGAGAGPFHVIGVNSELIPNLSYEVDKVTNKTYFAKVEDSGGVSCQLSPSEDCALMANLFGSDGNPGNVLKVTAKIRTGKMDFIECIREGLEDQFKDRTISVGGVFIIKKGMAKLHVMPDFSEEPLDTAQMATWLRFFDMSSPLVCLSVFHSHDPGLNLRMEHTHCFSQHGEGGHYHHDITPEDVEYEAYFNVASMIYRIDRPGK